MNELRGEIKELARSYNPVQILIAFPLAIAVFFFEILFTTTPIASDYLAPSAGKLLSRSRLAFWALGQIANAILVTFPVTV